ncbi:MAG: hypothetical protein IPL77_08850 [Flavobacteriales bacterium]|nr:hypothetical protein [Flavobacteriales bacterium]
MLASPEASIMQLFRRACAPSALYVLLTGFFLYAFYTWMDVTSFPWHVNALVDQAVLAGKDEADARARFSEFFSPFNYASLSFFLMLLLAAFNTLLVTVLLHKVVRRWCARVRRCRLRPSPPGRASTGSCHCSSSAERRGLC